MENYEDRIVNVDEYEMEKINNTLADAKNLVDVIENYLKMISYCDENGIVLSGLVEFDKIRYREQPAGPDNDLNKISSMFISAQTNIARQLNSGQVNEIIYKKNITDDVNRSVSKVLN